MIKPIVHKSCCNSQLDRLRHELDRGLKALERAKREVQSQKSLKHKTESMEYVKNYRHQLEVAELAEVEKIRRDNAEALSGQS